MPGSKRKLTSHFELTPKEKEVLELAKTMNNAQIAEYLGVKTWVVSNRIGVARDKTRVKFLNEKDKTKTGLLSSKDRAKNRVRSNRSVLN